MEIGGDVPSYAQEGCSSHVQEHRRPSRPPGLFDFLIGPGQFLGNDFKFGLEHGVQLLESRHFGDVAGVLYSNCGEMGIIGRCPAFGQAWPRGLCFFAYLQGWLRVL